MGKEKGPWRSAHHSMTPGPWMTLLLTRVLRGLKEVEGGDPRVLSCVGALGKGCPALSPGQRGQQLGQRGKFRVCVSGDEKEAA